MTSFTITPLTDHTAAEVTGLDFTQPIDSETRAALVSAFAERHVLVMRDQQFTPSKFKAAAQLFGELQPHDKKERHVPGHPDVDYICNDEIVDGKRVIPGETFHTDHSNHPCPPKATTLFAVELPTRGGDTQYVNMHDAYDDLPDETKRKIDGLKAVHVYQSKYSPRSLGKITEESRRQLPPPGIHPLVCTHPSKNRSPSIPDLPSAHEQGLTDFDIPSWYALFLPKGTPDAIVRKLHSATVAAMDMPSMQERLNKVGSDLVGSERRSPEYLAQFVGAEIRKWEAPIKSSGVQF